MIWSDSSKKVRKVLDKLRKMETYERIMIRSWLNDWYEYMKECEEE